MGLGSTAARRGTVQAAPCREAGDVNGDGFDDIIIGAPAADPNGNYSGAAYVVFGKGASFAPTLSLSALDGATGFKLSGPSSHRLGYSVSGSGDVNGDGFGDVIIGTYLIGDSYVVYGKAGIFPPNLNATGLNGINGFKIRQESGGPRAAVSGAGDVNGDGVDDLLIGNYLFSSSNGFASGAAWVVFGQVQQGVDLRLRMTDGAATVTPGGTLNYTLDYTNSGTVATSGVVITETLSPGVSFIARENPNWIRAGNTLTYNIGSLAVGASGTATLLLHTESPAAAGIAQITSTATISDDGTNGADRAPTNNIATDINTLDAAPDLSVTQTNAVTATAPGAALTYTLSYRNEGNQNATGVVLTETLPAGATFNAAASTPGWAETTAGSGVFKLDVGALAAGGAPETAVFALTLNSSAPAGVDQISVVAAVADDGANGPDPSPSNNTATDIDTLSAAPDVGVTLNDAVTSTTPGATLIYTLSYRNDGNQNATGVFLTETLPEGSTFNAAASTPGWTETAAGSGVFRLNVGALAGGGAAGTALFATTLNSPAAAGLEQFSSIATIADDNANGPDPNPGSNSATDTNVLEAAPDLAVTLSDAVSSTAPGAALIYTLTYRNNGNQNASGVFLTETLPAGATFNAAVSSPGWMETAPGSRLFKLNIGALAAGGAHGAALFAVTVNSPAAAGLEEVAGFATISDDGSNGPDPTPASNAATDSDVLHAAPDFVLTLNDAVSSTVPGAPLIYTLGYRNDGDQNAMGVFLTQTLPAGASFNTDASTPGWMETASGSGVFKLNVGALAGGGEQRTAVFAVSIISPAAAGLDQISSIANIADDAANGPDPTPANNTATEVDSLDAAPDLVVTLSNAVSSAAPGAAITYALSFRNDGNQDATGVFLTQTLPAGATFNAVSSSPGWTEADPGSGIFKLAIDPLGGGGTAGTAFFSVRLNTSAAAGQEQIFGIATIADDGANGPDSTPGNNVATDADPLDAAADLVITLSNAVSSTLAGWTLSENLFYRNDGNQDATGVVLTETVPAGATFDAASSSSGWTETVPGSGIFQFEIGALATTREGTVRFVLNVPHPSGGGIQRVLQSASIAGDGSSNDDPTPGNNNASESIKLFAPAFSANQRRATFTDSDGDLVTVAVNRGALSAADFTIFSTNDGTLRSTINLSDDGAEFSGASFAVAAKRPLGGTGDGFAHLGALDASGIDLVSVTISGDLARIQVGDGEPRKPALARLTVGSLGAHGALTQSDDTLQPLRSNFAGGLGALTVKGSLRNAVLDVAGDLGSAVIADDLDGSGGGFEAGVLRATGDILNVHVKGSVIGGGDRSGIFAEGKIGRVIIDDDLRSGEMAKPVIIAALGDLSAKTQVQATALAGLTVRGSVANARILAGYDPELAAVNADAAIGAVKITGSWSASSVAAGVADVTDDGFGHNDMLIPGGPATPTTLARIASITINGSALGTAAGSDHFGLVAEQIAKLNIGGTKQPLSTGANDSILDTIHGDFRAVDFA